MDDIRMRHRLDFNLDSDLYGWIESIARRYNLVHFLVDGTTRPRTAEVVRVLLAAELHAGRSLKYRLAAALYSHAVLGLSEHLALLVAGLRADLEATIAERVQVRASGPAPLAPRVGQIRTSGTLTLVLDDQLHDALTARLRAPGGIVPFERPRGSRVREPPPDVRLVRSLLLSARAGYDSRTRPVVERYARVVDGLRESIRAAVERERDGLRAALTDGSSDV